MKNLFSLRDSLEDALGFRSETREFNDLCLQALAEDQKQLPTYFSSQELLEGRPIEAREFNDLRIGLLAYNWKSQRHRGSLEDGLGLRREILELIDLRCGAL